jgi:putative NADPH-quinone reductase
VNVLIVYAHPEPKSFNGAMRDLAVQTLAGAGHEVVVSDLYAMGFNPVAGPGDMSGERNDPDFFSLQREQTAAYEAGRLSADIDVEIEKLKRADFVLFQFPIWWFGMPAILKGYIDRVWVPGVAFELKNGQTLPLLQNIRRFAVVTTYGSPWWLNKFVFHDPNRHVLMHGLRYLVSRNARGLWLALYGMDHRSDFRRRLFLRKVERRLRRF